MKSSKNRASWTRVEYRASLHNKQFVFVRQEGRNFVANRTGLPQAIFSAEFETIESLEYTESALEYKNFAVV